MTIEHNFDFITGHERNEIEHFTEVLVIEGRLYGRRVLRIEHLGALSVRVRFTDGSWQDLSGLAAVSPLRRRQAGGADAGARDRR